MTTLLSAVIEDPQSYAAYIQQETRIQSRLLASGAITESPLLTRMFANGGSMHNVPSLADLDHTEAETVADDSSATAITTLTLATDRQRVYALRRQAAWSSTDLSSELMGTDPLGMVGRRAARYEAKRLEVAILHAIDGYIEDNRINDSSSHLNDVTASYVEGVTDVTAKNLLDTFDQLGESMDDVAAIVAHPTVITGMKKKNLIDSIPDTTNAAALGVMGRFGTVPVIMSSQGRFADTTPNRGLVAQGANDYYTYIIGRGAIQMAFVPRDMPVEAYRDARSHGGVGEETLVYRFGWAPVINGVDNTAGGGAYVLGGPTNAELAEGANWNRVFPEDQVNVAVLETTEA